MISTVWLPVGELRKRFFELAVKSREGVTLSKNVIILILYNIN